MANADGNKALMDALTIQTRKAGERKRALEAVLNWLDRKPTPGGKTYGHGSQEMRALIEKALSQ